MRLRPHCEFIDSSDGRLLIGMRLAGADLPEGSIFQLRLRSRSGRPAWIAQTTIGVRVNAVGTRTRSALRFQVPVDRLQDRAFRLQVSPVDAAEWTDVRPASGLLAAARPTPIGNRRYQVFPGAGRPTTWLRMSSWSAGAQLGWAVRNLLREAAFVAQGRRFSWVRPVRAFTRPLVPRGRVWLIGERPETARDNGYALFQHLRTATPDAPVYYVLDRQSPAATRVQTLGHVVWHSSWRHRLLMLHAEVLANPYSIKHMLPSRWRPGAYMNQCAWRVGAYRVYLKHGVHLSPEAMKRANGGYDLVCTVGEREAAAIEKTSGYRRSQLRQTGLARYDHLVPQPGSRTVLFMPTWRRYLVPKLFAPDSTASVAYEGSTYQQFIDGFLDAPETEQLLQRHDLQLVVVPHYNLNGLLAGRSYPGDRIQVLDGTTADIPALLRGCAILVTDYSSVQFDVAYAGTPVVYAQFDREEYAQGHSAPSWFSPERDGFGPVCTTIEEVRTALVHYAEREFAREDIFSMRAESFFSFRDRDNCARIIAEISRLTADREPGAGPRRMAH